jgi:nicotinic acid mononucleotide adenylyltransferase
MQIKKQITKSIALYGGAFDPPHYGHMAVLKKLEELLFVS